MLTTAVVATLNHLLAQAEWARRRLQPHAGRVAELQLPLGPARFRIANEGFLAAEAGEMRAELVLTVPGDAALAVLSGGSEAAMKHVCIAGNAEFGESLGFVLRHLEWDAEADLARAVGEFAAPRLHRGAIGVLAWHREAMQRVSANLRDYFVIERPTLVGSAELEAFSSELSHFRDDLARLERRIGKAGGARLPTAERRQG